MSPYLRHTLRRALLMASALVLLAATGWLISPFTRALRQGQEAAGLHYPVPELDRQDALSQQLAVFCLGGLRTLAAEILSLDATNAWMKRDWPRAEKRWSAATTLAPHRLNYWVSASRDMATNAAGDVAHDRRLSEQEQAVQQRHYIDAGERFLLKGIAHNPDSILLHARLGDLYSDLYRRPRFAKAAEAYRRAVALGASPLYERQVFYNLCRIRGREKEAWELGRQLWQNPQNHVPSVRVLLFVLQHKIEVPAEERLSPEQLFGSPEQAVRYLNLFVRNSLHYPTTGIQEYLKQMTNDE